jgi:hypothetical protein
MPDHIAGSAWWRVWKPLASGPRRSNYRQVLTPTEIDLELTRLQAAAWQGGHDEVSARIAWLTALTPRLLVRVDERARFRSWVQARPLAAADAWHAVDLRARSGLPAMVAALHPSGYLREAAVKALSDVRVPATTQLLALRATDHVEKVRRSAHATLLTRVSEADVIAAVPVLLATRARKHGASPYTAYLTAAKVTERAELLTSSSDRRTRRLGYDQLLTRSRLSSAELIDHLEIETDQLIKRTLAEALTGRDRGAAKTYLLHGRYVEGRLIALQYLDDADFDADDLRSRMLDRSPRVRDAARWRYRRAGQNPVDFYRDAQARTDVAEPWLDVVLSGLRECGEIIGDEEALGLLDSSDARTRLAALRLWRRPTKAALLRSIVDPSTRVSSAAARMLGRNGTTSYGDVAGAANSGVAAHRRGAWLVRRELGAWDRVRADLETMSDPDPTLADTARDDLLRWLQHRAATTYAKPMPSQREAIREHLETAGLGVHEAGLIAFHAGLQR